MFFQVPEIQNGHYNHHDVNAFVRQPKTHMDDRSATWRIAAAVCWPAAEAIPAGKFIPAGRSTLSQ